MHHNLVQYLREIIVEISAESCTLREILDKLLKVKSFNSEKCPQCETIFSCPTIQSDKAEANFTVNQLTNHLLQLKTDVVDNRNISDRGIGR